MLSILLYGKLFSTYKDVVSMSSLSIVMGHLRTGNSIRYTKQEIHFVKTNTFTLYASFPTL